HVWVVGLHVSVVHALASSQSVLTLQQPEIGVPTHCPAALHASLPVQSLRSSHVVPVLGALIQCPVEGSQESAVHGLLSLQSVGTECLQVPSGLQVPTVQASLSSHKEPNKLQSLAQGPGKSPCARWEARAVALMVMV